MGVIYYYCLIPIPLKWKMYASIYKLTNTVGLCMYTVDIADTKQPKIYSLGPILTACINRLEYLNNM